MPQFATNCKNKYTHRLGIIGPKLRHFSIIALLVLFCIIHGFSSASRGQPIISQHAQTGTQLRGDVQTPQGRTLNWRDKMKWPRQR